MNNPTIDIDFPPYLKKAIENRLNQKIVFWTKPDFGLSNAIRFSLLLENNNKVFVKAATDTDTEGWLRTEHSVLSSYKEEFMPKIIDWIEEPENFPILITQDFSDAYWAANNNGVSWRNGDIDLLLETVKRLSNVKGHHTLSHLKSNNANVWTKIASNPDGFLKLKLCSKKWLLDNIEYLIMAENNVNETGTTLVHGDIRSDNICIKNNNVVFVDWSNAAIGNAEHDLANLLPTLQLEGGPLPFQIMPNAANQAAYICATHIQRLSKNSTMPMWLATVFKKLIAIELEWTTQCLNLDRPDGIDWKQIN
ncbi:MAG: phosphotransferase [Bacteroidetes bacterium]|nr:phosphotransferase [Bacteroidota bacterium]